MRKIVLGASVALTAALSTTLGFNARVEALPLDRGSSFLVAQSEVITPTTLEPITEAAQYYAFVDSFDGQTLYVRLPDGQVQSFTLPEGVGGVEEYSLSPGDLVALNADKNNVISGLDNPVVETEFVGNVESFDGTQLVAKSVTGETITTPVSERVATALDIKPGDEVKVTSFQNIPGLSSVCKVKRAAFQPPAPEPFVAPPEPFVPPVVEALPALW